MIGFIGEMKTTDLTITNTQSVIYESDIRMISTMQAFVSVSWIGFCAN
jgi:hypothetical protein